jgi:hypothetical protein
LIRNGETTGAVDHNEYRVHCDSIEESGIHLDEQSLRDRRVNSLLVTQIIMPTRPKNVAKRIARTIFFLPENAYVRNIRMTVDEIRQEPVRNVDWAVLTLGRERL